MPETSQYMTTREVAALMRVKERKIYDLVAKGDIPVSKTTGKLLFPKDAVLAWIDKDSCLYQSRPAQHLLETVICLLSC